MNRCRRVSAENGLKLIKIFLPISILTVTLGCFLVSYLLKKLRREVKIYFLLQQIMGVLALLFTFAPSIIHYVVLKSMEELGSAIGKHAFLLKFTYISDFLKNLTYCQHHMFSLLQVFNYRSMICDPMNFDEYKKWKNALKRVILSSVLSALLSTEFLVQCTFRFLIRSISQSFLRKANFVISILTTIKFVIVKLCYTLALVTASMKIKKSLDQSNGLRNGQGRGLMTGPFLCICMIPIVNNVLSLVSDVPELLLSSSHITNSDEASCNRLTGFSVDVHLPMTATTFLIASALLTMAYWISFPSLRIRFCNSRSDGSNHEVE